ncbi:MAG: hypothetical protein J3K34DRAFT_518792 [Monoraphidium minutum]|nr:MAG: hypothetical protein J3K34DRAFT_518792 [Monoraphidium minutum]
MRWYVLYREPFCVALDAGCHTLLLVGAAFCVRPLPDEARGMLRLVVLASCGSLFYIQLRLRAFLCQLAIKLVYITGFGYILAPVRAAWLPLAGSAAAAGAAAAWVMVANSVRSRERFLEQCVRPAALMVPDSGGGGAGGADDSGGASGGGSGGGGRHAEEFQAPEAPLAPGTPHLGPAERAAEAAAAAAVAAATAPAAGAAAASPFAGGGWAGGAAAAAPQLFMPLGFRERSCSLVVKGQATGAGAPLLVDTSEAGGLPGCSLVRFELLVRGALRDGAGAGFWGSPGVAAVCAALRHTPPTPVAARAAAAMPGGGAAGSNGVVGGGGGGAIAAAPPGYQEMQCVMLAGGECCRPQVPSWLAGAGDGSAAAGAPAAPGGAASRPGTPGGAGGAAVGGAAPAAGGGGAANGAAPRAPAGAAGVTGGAGRTPRAPRGGRAAGRRRSSASIVECVRAAASALAPAAAPPSGAGLNGRPPAAPPLAGLGLRECFVSLLVKEPAVSLAADPGLAALLPDFTEVRVTLLTRV